MATAILADPQFLKHAAGWVRTGRFRLGIPDVDHLVIWDPTSAGAASIESKVRGYSRAGAVNLDPVVLEVDGASVKPC